MTSGGDVDKGNEGGGGVTTVVMNTDSRGGGVGSGLVPVEKVSQKERWGQLSPGEEETESRREGRGQTKNSGTCTTESPTTEGPGDY